MKWQILDENGKVVKLLVKGSMRDAFTTKTHAEWVLARQKGKRAKMYRIVEVDDVE